MFHLQNVPVEGISVVTAPHLFPHLTMQNVVVLDGSAGPLSREQEEALQAQRREIAELRAAWREQVQ